MIIGTVGFIGSGKGAVGEYISKEYGFKEDSFANPLKDAVATIFGWDREMLEGVTKKSRQWREQVDKYWSDVCERAITPRNVLQLFGTESIRDIFHEDVWSASLIRRCVIQKKGEEGEVNVIVTDTRFENEIETIRNHGGQVWLIKRDKPEWLEDYIRLYREKNFHQIEKNRKMGLFPHRSETDWIGSWLDGNIDVEIENDGTLGDLYKKVDELMLHKVKVKDQVINYFGG